MNSAQSARIIAMGVSFMVLQRNQKALTQFGIHGRPTYPKNPESLGRLRDEFKFTTQYVHITFLYCIILAHVCLSFALSSRVQITVERFARARGFLTQTSESCPHETSRQEY
jgi:hypothetical protein